MKKRHSGQQRKREVHSMRQQTCEKQNGQQQLLWKNFSLQQILGKKNSCHQQIVKRRMINISAIFSFAIVIGIGFAQTEPILAAQKDDTIVLRVCNWEEYIDLGDWDEEEEIDLSNGVCILGENPLYEEFEDWYYETYGKRVKVEYSCAGTNEELYSQLTLGDTYDLICPSDYMMMKLIAEGQAEPFSKEFFDTNNEYNYYSKGVSPYIRDVFSSNEIQGESWDTYAACYMWGTTGVLYNPEYMTQAEASTWEVFQNPKFYRQITLKDNVRDSLFATIGLLKQDTLCDEGFLNDANYAEKLQEIMNDTSAETIEEAQDLLQDMMGNIYALETDSGKADMITGKIKASYQWSGDAVYAMDQAEESGVYLSYAVPKECTNLWFDGWMMLKKGIAQDTEKKQAAEAFVNFLSRPDNVVRNMYYIGYTSAIAGGEDDTIFSYIEWCYGADDEMTGDASEDDLVSDDTVKENVSDYDKNSVSSEDLTEELCEYPLGYFFSGDDSDERYILTTTSYQINRQLYTQYPSKEVISRAAVMGYFDEEEATRINQMWINVRCFNITDVTAPQWIFIGCVVLLVVASIIWKKKNKIKVK